MPVFTLYMDYDVRYEVASDAVAAQIARTIHAAVSDALADSMPSDSIELLTHVQARRGSHNKVVYDVENDRYDEVR
jgi:hypothetical protein